MTSKSKQKGNRFERELVDFLNDIPNTYSERTWGSSGRSRGLPDEVDLVLDYYNLDLTIQAKNWKWESYPAGFRSFSQNLLTNVNIGIIKKERDINNSLVIMNLDTLKKLMGSNND